MKIVINAFSARIGGGRTYLKNLLSRLPDDPSLELLVYAPADLDLPTERRITRGSTSFPVVNPLLRLFWEHFILPRRMRQFGAQVLFCPGGVVNTRPPKGTRVVTMFRNMLPFDKQALSALPWGIQKLRNLLLRRQMLRSMKAADLTIFISEYARRTIEQLIDLKRAATIPHGIGEAFLGGLSQFPRPEEAGERPYLLYVSRFEAYKHHLQVAQAFGMLPPDLRDKYRLLLVGEDNYAPAEEVRRYIAESGLTETIQLTGSIAYERLPALYQHAQLIVFASACENCPNILLEALGAGRPVLSSNIDPMPEFGGEDLIYFSPYDPAQLSEAMRKVLSDEELAQHVAKAAGKRAQRYDWDRTAKDTWAEIEDIAKAHENNA